MLLAFGSRFTFYRSTYMHAQNIMILVKPQPRIYRIRLTCYCELSELLFVAVLNEKSDAAAQPHSKAACRRCTERKASSLPVCSFSFARGMP